MPVTDKVQIFFMQTGDRFWTNVFHVNAVNVDAAAAWANTTLAGVMKVQLNNAFSVTKTVVNHLADNSFVSTPLALPGEVTAGNYLPLFNTIKVNFLVAGHGRNDYKYVRGWLNEGIVTNGQIDSSPLGVIEGIFDGLISDSTAAGVDLVDADGHLWIGASVQAAMQMRQLHRKRKKTPAP